MSNYILLKDLPDTNAGTVFVHTPIGKCTPPRYRYLNNSGSDIYVEGKIVEQNPEWFKEEKLSAPDLKMNGRVTKIVWEDDEGKEHKLYFDK